ncbi:ATP-binding cassette domain-containing protein [Niallia circulans]
MDSFVKMQDVSFTYDHTTILNKINLNLEKGKSYALIGKSGVGKSTLLHLLAGFLNPTEGEILMDGKRIQHPQKDIGFMFQDLGLFPWLNVFDAISMPLKLDNRKAKQEIKDRVTALIREVGLSGMESKYPTELSGGQQQRVALARTLINKPDLLLMDEPTSTLDEMTKEQIQQLIAEQVEKRQTTLLFVTHNIEEAVLLGSLFYCYKIMGISRRLKIRYLE